MCLVVRSLTHLHQIFEVNKEKLDKRMEAILQLADNFFSWLKSSFHFLYFLLIPLLSEKEINTRLCNPYSFVLVSSNRSFLTWKV